MPAPQALDPSASSLLDRLVAAIAGLIALVLPLVYFILGHTALSSALSVTAQVKSDIINQTIQTSPEMWRHQTAGLQALLVSFPVTIDNEHVRILDPQGRVLADSPQPVSQPAMRRSAPLHDAHGPIGHIEINHSLRDLLIGTARAALFSLALAAGLVALLRGLRKRERQLAGAMFDEQERARVTLDSIGDAVITTDAAGRIVYLNPVAERLTLWTLADALGRELPEVCQLIDESTTEVLPNPIHKTLREGVVCPFGGEDVALLRCDGTRIAVEQSASPLHDRSGAVIGAALVFHDVTIVRRMAQRITWAASHDALTGLVNRREFENRIEAAVFRARNFDRQHVLCYVDLDQFKVINDSCGHAAGDGLLRQLAGVLQQRLREADTLARLGGDEFGVLLEGCSLKRAELVAADLMAAIREFRYPYDGSVFNVSASIGLVTIDAETANSAEVFSTADTACYSAKEQGRNRICVFENSAVEMQQRRNELGWAAKLNSALKQDRFVLYHQRYLPLDPQASAGAHIEILLRLIDEDGTMVMPGSFLPAAERYNLMPQIDRWVIRHVFARYADLRLQLGAPLTCAINLSGSSLNAEGLLDYIREQAHLHALPPDCVCFEITETVAINNLRHAAVFMRDAKLLGFSFALDDFGVGTSSFGYLKSLPVDYLKIDGSFVKNILNDPIDRAMAETINRIGHIMGLKTVAEFAETDDVIDALRTIGVDYAQGYGVHRPSPLPSPRTFKAWKDSSSPASALAATVSGLASQT